MIAIRRPGFRGELLAALLLALAGCAVQPPTPLRGSLEAPTEAPPATPSATLVGATVRIQAEGTIPCQSAYGCRAVVTIVAAPTAGQTLEPLIEEGGIELAGTREQMDMAIVDDTIVLDRRLTLGSYLVVAQGQLTSDVSSIAPDGTTVFPAVGESGRCAAPLTVADGQPLVQIVIAFRQAGGCSITVEAD